MPRKITNEEAIERLSINNSNVIILDRYYSSEEKSHFKCLICNCEWKANAKGVINGKNGCPDCGKKKARETIKYNITTDDFRKKIEKIFKGKLNVLGEYVNYYTNIDIKCNICGHIWITKPTHLISHQGCTICGHIEKGKKCRKKPDKFISEIKMIYGNKLSLLEEYTIGENKIKVKCNVCKYEWSPISRRLLRRGCPKCNFSKGELLISNILEELKIDFQGQYVFDGLKTEKNGVPIFDFVIFDEFNNIKSIIEYDGEQHFKAIKKFGGLPRLQQQQKVDEFKNNYCYKNNIKMNRIPYTELKNINNEYIKKLL